MYKSSIMNKCSDCHEAFTTKIGFLNHVCILKLDTSIGREIEVKTQTEKSNKKIRPAMKGKSCCDICDEDSYKYCQEHRFNPHTKNNKINIGREIEITSIGLENQNYKKTKFAAVKETVERKSLESVVNRMKESQGAKQNLINQTNPSPLKRAATNSSPSKRLSSDYQDDTKPSDQTRPAKKYVCSKCPEIFNTIKDYRQHYKIHLFEITDSDYQEEIKPTIQSRPAKTYVCSKCPDRFNSIRDYRQHYKTHPFEITEQDPVKTLPSDGITSTDQSRPAKTYVCSKCPEIFNTIRDYRQHNKFHDSNDASSLQSEKISVLQPSLNQSTVVVHTPSKRGRKKKILTSPSSKPSPSNKTIKTYVCSFCPEEMPEVFHSIRDYREHCRNYHPEGMEAVSLTEVAPEKEITSRYTCPNCPCTFKKVGSYRRHLRSHLKIPSYHCKHCLLSYLEKGQLKSHASREHSHEKYTCLKCKKKFFHRMSFMEHKIEHLRSDPKAPYICHLCGAVFPTLSRRLRHLTNHAFKCPICRKPQADENRFLQHMSTIHNDVKDCDFPEDTSEEEDSDCENSVIDSFDELDIESDEDSFTSFDSDSDNKSAGASSPKKKKKQHKKHHICFICERRFPKLKSLENHMKFHEIYTCPSCLKFFPRANLLKSHLKEHMQKNKNLASNLFEKLQTSVQHPFQISQAINKSLLNAGVQQPLQIAPASIQPLLTTTVQQPFSTTGQQPFSNTGQQPFSNTGQQPFSTTGQQPFSTTGQQLYQIPTATVQPLLTTTTQHPIPAVSEPLAVHSLNDPPNNTDYDINLSPEVDFIAWYNDFKNIAKNLKYPIGHDLYQSIYQIIFQLTSTFYSNTMPQDTRESYVKIHNDLMSIITKNNMHLVDENN